MLLNGILKFAASYNSNEKFLNKLGRVTFETSSINFDLRQIRWPQRKGLKENELSLFPLGVKIRTFRVKALRYKLLRLNPLVGVVGHSCNTDENQIMTSNFQSGCINILLHPHRTTIVDRWLHSHRLQKAHTLKGQLFRITITLNL